MSTLAVAPLRQRADYTHRYNTKTGRHGWLRLTPAYSVRVVEELMNQAQGRLRVLDPFCGTATTALSAAHHGHDAVTTDINPFLIWLGRAKTAHYSDIAIAQADMACREILGLLKASHIKPKAPPLIHDIERWWSPQALDFLCRLQAGIEMVTSPEVDEGVLLRVAFCRTLMGCSNAAFNHQSMSFRDMRQVELGIQLDYGELFRENVLFVLHGAAENPVGHAEVLLHDAREVGKLDTCPFDFVVTSPPYANRMSYVRELRPYMYWLHFLESGREAGELDWLAIGGTWGVATSRLHDWKPQAEDYTSEGLESVLASIAHSDNANGELLATYIRKYCSDMARHFVGLGEILAPGAELHYIIGNSTFYGELLSVESIYAGILRSLGYRNIVIRPLRKRNSKKELVEYDVSARWK